MIDLSLCLVTDSALAARAGHDLADVVSEAASNGVTSVQVREKTLSGRAFLETVCRIAEVVPDGVPVLVNDRVDVYLAARAAGAAVAGVHVGQSDLPPALVRALIGDEAVLGLSAGTPEQIARAVRDEGRIDYVGIGALHPTRTKHDAPPALGLAGAQRVLAACALPAVVIGGVTAVDVPGLRAAGAAGVAVVSAICGAPDPGSAARELRRAWEEAA